MQHKRQTESIGDGLGFEYYDQYLDQYSKMTKEELLRELAGLHCYINFLMTCSKDTEKRLDMIEARQQQKDPFSQLQQWYENSK